MRREMESYNSLLSRTLSLPLYQRNTPPAISDRVLWSSINRSSSSKPSELLRNTFMSLTYPQIQLPLLHWSIFLILRNCMTFCPCFFFCEPEKVLKNISLPSFNQCPLMKVERVRRATCWTFWSDSFDLTWHLSSTVDRFHSSWLSLGIQWDISTYFYYICCDNLTKSLRYIPTTIHPTRNS